MTAGKHRPTETSSAVACKMSLPPVVQKQGSTETSSAVASARAGGSRHDPATRISNTDRSQAAAHAMVDSDT